MNSRTVFSAAFLCGLLLVSIIICGCTSSSETPAAGTDSLPAVSAETAAMAGTYTSVEDQVSQIVLEADGRASIVKPTGTIAGTFTMENGEIRICVEESDGRSCLRAPVEPDGSFVLGQNTYKQ
jgi:hypothetical protein